MPQRDHAPIGAPTWLELWSTDPDRSLAFYGDLFGWEHDEPIEEFGGYINVHKDGKKVAGAMKSDGTVPPHWSVYLRTADAAATEREAADGGSVVAPAMAVMELGTMVVLTDPSGATIGGWEDGTHHGVEVVLEPGWPAWFELLTKDYDAVLPWYRRVFGFDVVTFADEPDFRYSGYGEDRSGCAGIMDASGFLPPEVPSHWSVYFHTADTAASIARVQELGGQVVQGPDDTPYGVLTTCVDPTGVTFKLQEPPAQPA